MMIDFRFLFGTSNRMLDHVRFHQIAIWNLLVAQVVLLIGIMDFRLGHL